MTHPDPQDLMGFLYDELDADRRADVAGHLDGCEACRERVASWRGVRTELAAWEVPDRPRPAAAPLRTAREWPVVRWAAAAAVLIGTGFGLAWLSGKPEPVVTATPDVANLRADLSREIREQLGAELRAALRTELAAGQAQFASDETARRAAFERAVAQALGNLEARQAAQHAALRRDVETVALRAREELDQLAVAARPAVDLSQQ